jgi:hypothetical protein
VFQSGTLDTSRSRNVTASTLATIQNAPATGIYCLTVGLPVTRMSVTIDAANSSNGAGGSGSGALSGQDPNNFIGQDCPAGYNAIVATTGNTVTNGIVANADLAFWVSFD